MAYRPLSGQQLTNIEGIDLLLFGGKGCPFSNFLIKPFQTECPWDGEWREAKTAEHAFQAFKAQDKEEGLKVLQTPGPSFAKKMGRSVVMREDWEQEVGHIGEQTVLKKIEVMFDILQSKFSIPQLEDLLLSTEHLVLVEKAPWDPVWGAGKNGTGKNYLGRCLMTLRHYKQEGELKFTPQTPHIPV